MEEKSLKITLQTLTPLWTGGVDRRSDRLHLTGIIGSLRWWFEAMIRGVGGQVCNPESSCIYNTDKPDELCNACRVFGTTGWARRFRMVVRDETELQAISLPKTIVIMHDDGKKSTWYLPTEPLKGQVKIEIIATGPLKVANNEAERSSNEGPFRLEMIGELLQFIADWASLGAKPQMGFGLVHIMDRQSPLYLLEYLQNIPKITDKKIINNLQPSLQRMFFASVRTKSPLKDETFRLKYYLRRQLTSEAEDVRHFVMGTVQGNKENHQGAKIMMSFPYENHIRIWGWIPETFKITTPHKEIIKNIPYRQVGEKVYEYLIKAYGKNNIAYWRQFDSPNDSRYTNYDALNFLESLIKGEK